MAQTPGQTGTAQVVDRTEEKVQRVRDCRGRGHDLLLEGSPEIVPPQTRRFRFLRPIHSLLSEQLSDPAAESPGQDDPTPAPQEEPPRSRTIRVIIADDHRILREGLIGLLRNHPDIQVVGQAADGHEALELTRQLRPDVVIMDVSMPRMNGLQATQVIAQELPDVRIVGLSMHEKADMAQAMLAAGARAYVTKGGPSEDLLDAIRG